MLIAGVIGLLFMIGGFAVGLKLMPVPPHAPVKAATAAVATTPGLNASPTAPDPISLDSLKQTSQSMMSLNEALKLRENQVTEREQKVRAREDELVAEREALDNSHDKFKALFTEFKQRLDLVETHQVEDLQKQADLYQSMGADQAIDLIRSMDDPAVTRLFSVMDVKPLGKLVAQWKTKYPDDAPRLMHALDNMAKVMPKEKITLADSAPDSSAPAATTPDSAPPAAAVPTANETAPSAPAASPVADTVAPAPTAEAPSDSSAPTPVATPDAAAPASTPSTQNASSPATPSPLAPPADPAQNQVPTEKTSDTDTPPAASPAVPSDSTAPAPPRATPVDTGTPTTSASPDITTPGATAATAIPDPDNALPTNPTPPAALPADSTMNTPRSPRALPVNITTVTTE